MAVMSWKHTCVFAAALLVAALALPPSILAQRPSAPALLEQFDTDRSKYIIDLSELQAGGPPKDGIPSIDAPSFVSTEAARDWIEPQEPVIALELGGGGHARAAGATWYGNRKEAEEHLIPILTSAVQAKQPPAGNPAETTL